ncbi:rhodanese domain-containing protein CG4456-like isoform X1 [Chironomus tepperi]|uniref:rhodanese domain-containing protein CG4456-like isoform X1 n=1 Tax=Chironomus tepperi TaxID=113505 RepID=UPI00391F18C4
MSNSVFRVLSTLTSLRCLSAVPTINRAFNSAITTKYPVSALNYKLQVRGNSVNAGSNDVIDLTKFVTYEEIKELPNYPAKMLIDVREPKELEETGRIPTSINIPLKQVAEKLSQDFSADNFKTLFNREKPTVDTEIIFHCKIGVRSQTATDLCYKLGYKNVKNYKGSWIEWAEKEGLKK